MNICTMDNPLRTLIIGLALTIGVGEAQQPSTGRVDSKDIEPIIRQYILDHPEVVLQSVAIYEQQKESAQRKRAQDAVVTHQSDLLKDAASPVAEPSDTSKEPITVVEFFDYRCGYCRKMESTVAKFAGAPGVRIVYKEFPILGPDSLFASKAALAAAKQGKYQKFHEALMASSSPVTPEIVEKLAVGLGLDAGRLKRDMDSHEIEAALARNNQLAEALGIQSTPTFVVGKQLMPGALTAEVFQSLIDGARSEAKSVPAPGSGGN